MAVVRRRIGDREDRFFSTVFLGSGLLNVALTLVGSSAIASVAVAAQSDFGSGIEGSSAAVMVGFGFSLVAVILPRIQAVFIPSLSTLALRTLTFRRGIVFFGYAIAAGMLLFPLVFDSLGLAFPLWVLIISVAMLVRSDLVRSARRR